MYRWGFLGHWSYKDFTWRRPSRVLCIVTHFVGWVPFVVIAVMSASNSSRFSFNFFTRDSIALFENASLSPPCLKETIWNEKKSQLVL